MTEPSGRPVVEPGPLAEEAARLVDAALGWARRTAEVVSGPDDAAGPSGAECSSCPVCRLLRGVREERPELAERLTAAVIELGSGVAGLLRVVAEVRAADPVPEPPHRPGRPPVERIDLT